MSTGDSENRNQIWFVLQTKADEEEAVTTGFS